MADHEGRKGALAANLAVVRRRIDEAGGAGRVRLVAVTKGFDVGAVRAALDLGLHDLGENYAQELLGKHADLTAAGAPPLPVPPTWHFLGRVQRRKVRDLAPVVGLWHGLDRPEVAEELAWRGPGASVLVQVAAWGEPQKGGVAPAEVPDLVARARDLGLDVQGLMAIAPAGPAGDARAGFAAVRALADALGLAECSMGMTDDLEVAVQEGATMVRVGRALFGPRSGPGVVRN